MSHKDYTYKKESQNGIKWYCGKISRDKRIFLNPSEQMLLEDGWHKHYIEPPVLYSGDEDNIQEGILERVLSNFPNLDGLIFPVTNGIIYHYTTWEVMFKGILNENNCDSNGNRCLVLRAYSVNYMNDTSEGLLLPISVANRELEVIEERYGNESMQNPLLKRRYDIWKKGAEQHKQKQFSISFSHNKDSLPMWNYYGFNGKGICLGFDVKTLWNQGYEIYDCIYDANKTQKLAVLFYDNIGNNQNFLNILAKDSHFEYEKECRIPIVSIYNGKYVKTDRDIFYPIKFDLKGGYIVPYVEMYLPLSSIKEIVIGPTNNIGRAEDSLKGWLSSINMKNVKVKNSNAPLAK